MTKTYKLNSRLPVSRVLLNGETARSVAASRFARTQCERTLLLVECMGSGVRVGSMVEEGCEELLFNGVLKKSVLMLTE